MNKAKQREEDSYGPSGFHVPLNQQAKLELLLVKTTDSDFQGTAVLQVLCLWTTGDPLRCFLAYPQMGSSVTGTLEQPSVGSADHERLQGRTCESLI